MDERLRVREGIVMWAIEHSIETAASPEAIWRLWSDVGRWPEWNADLERAELLGSFAVGSVVTMFPHQQDPIELRIAEVQEPERFVDEADLGDVVVRTTRPEADRRGPHIGPEISTDFPEVLAALAKMAEC
jgi:hypothetical protein